MENLWHENYKYFGLRIHRLDHFKFQNQYTLKMSHKFNFYSSIIILSWVNIAVANDDFYSFKDFASLLDMLVERENFKFHSFTVVCSEINTNIMINYM